MSSIKTHSIGYHEKEAVELKRESRERRKEIVENCIVTPASLVLNAVLFGFCFSVILYMSVSAFVLALKW